MKIRTEGGSGGKKGHSNMVHRDKTAEVKAAARKARRVNDKIHVGISDNVQTWDGNAWVDLHDENGRAIPVPRDWDLERILDQRELDRSEAEWFDRAFNLRDYRVEFTNGFDPMVVFAEDPESAIRMATEQFRSTWKFATGALHVKACTPTFFKGA